MAAPPRRAPSKSDRICIVGAGPGGLSTAFFLEERGYRRVTVLEKNQDVGGKARSWWVDGRPVDLGALDVGQSYRRVRALAKLVGQPLVPTAQMGMMDFRTETARSDLTTLLDGVGKLQLGWMIAKYLWLTGARYADYLESPGMVGAPPELCVPMSEWLQSHGMLPLKPVFDYLCTNFGYGPVEAIPAAYLLRFIDFWDMVEVLEVDLGIRSWPRNFQNGYQSLWEGVAGRLRDVRTGVEIEGVRREPMSPDPVRVRLRGHDEPEAFDHVVVACCLDGSLGTVLEDLSGPTKALFSRVVTQPYSTTVCRTSGLPRMALGTIPLTESGRVYCMIRNWDEGLGSAYYMMNRQGLTHEELFRNLKADMAALRTLDGAPAGIRVEEIVHHEDWAYFPHVTPTDLAGGFYDEVESLQGCFNTYFTGGLMGFETVHNTVKYSESLVERFFPA